MAIEQLRDLRFPSGLAWDLATISCRVHDLGGQLGVTCERWEEDGLGWMTGFALGPPETPVLVREPEFGLAGRPFVTVVIVDGNEAAEMGHRATLDRVLAVLGLEDRDVSWSPDDVSQWALDAQRRVEAGRSDL